ncbi:MAG: alpha/beta hydrolase [Azoarcus sp.]|jgi:pimeloyl-ACP methyl ester carboxylesterase|nr:alpha/beta hydrolase [Azoarcus sp.]
MPLIDTGHKVKLETIVYGEPDAPAILLIQGLGTPLTRWQTSLPKRLVDAGFRVITFDNRDIGLSTQMDTLGLPDIKSLMSVSLSALSMPVPPSRVALATSYTLDDMALDATALLDALHIDAAHIVGASLGGMIAQWLAFRYPTRCLSLTSIMSSSGNLLLPSPTPAAMHAMFAPLPGSRDEAALVEDCIWRQKVLMSPGYPTSDDELRAMFTSEYRRAGFHPKGVIRQVSALLSAGDRRAMLLSVRAPTVVLHGEDDPLINIACGHDTAAAIPGAEFRSIPGMGHDFPEALAGEFASAILAAAQRAENR